MTEQTFTPFLEREILVGGVQKIYKFENGYGASVVRHMGSYGSDEGLWELGVMVEDPADPRVEGMRLTYSTPITDDVIGRLEDDEIPPLLARIQDLPADKEI